MTRSHQCTGEYAEYDPDWCCAPQSWCEFFHYTFYEMLFGVLFLAVLFSIQGRDRLVRLKQRMRTTGTAIMAAVIGKSSKCVSEKHKTYEYYVRVDFINLQGRQVLKDIEVSKESFEKITVPDSLTLFQLPEYPVSAVVDDQYAATKRWWEKPILFVLGVVCLGFVGALFFWFIQTFDVFVQALPRVALSALCQLPVFAVCWYIGKIDYEEGGCNSAR